jgi:hypothetical protein
VNTGSDHDRRMFYVIEGHLLLANHGYPYSHQEWLFGLLGYADEERVRQIHLTATRGFWKDGVLVCYTGGNAFSRYVKQVDVALAFSVLDAVHGVKEIHLGMPAKCVIEGERMLEYVGKPKKGE